MNVNLDQEINWWNGKAGNEEIDLADEKINRQLRWNIIKRHLADVRTIADIGASTGAFSIPLARLGYDVTHVDFSPEMLRIAREKAAGIPNIKIVEANSTDLSAFADNSFDMVINSDGAISFCGDEAGRAIAESCRIAGKTIILTVSNRAQMIPVWLSESIIKTGKILPAAREMFDNGHWHYEQFESNREIIDRYFGTLKAFTRGELETALKNNGMAVVSVRALGSLSCLCEKEALTKLKYDEDLFREFIALCERYDSEIMPDGPGTRQRAGLVAIARKG